MDKAKRLKTDSGLMFKNPEVEGQGILLKLRFKKNQF